MKVEFLDSFVDKLANQVEYIAQDKPQAARKFKKEILKLCKELAGFPFRNRKSIYFKNENIRDLIYKGYIIIYKVDKKKGLISIFALIKHENSLK